MTPISHFKLDLHALEVLNFNGRLYCWTVKKSKIWTPRKKLNIYSYALLNTFDFELTLQFNMNCVTTLTFEWQIIWSPSADFLLNW